MARIFDLVGYVLIFTALAFITLSVTNDVFGSFTVTVQETVAQASAAQASAAQASAAQASAAQVLKNTVWKTKKVVDDTETDIFLYITKAGNDHPLEYSFKYEHDYFLITTFHFAIIIDNEEKALSYGNHTLDLAVEDVKTGLRDCELSTYFMRIAKTEFKIQKKIFSVIFWPSEFVLAIKNGERMRQEILDSCQNLFTDSFAKYGLKIDGPLLSHSINHKKYEGILNNLERMPGGAKFSLLVMLSPIGVGLYVVLSYYFFKYLIRVMRHLHRMYAYVCPIIEKDDIGFYDVNGNTVYRFKGERVPYGCKKIRVSWRWKEPLPNSFATVKKGPENLNELFHGENSTTFDFFIGNNKLLVCEVVWEFESVENIVTALKYNGDFFSRMERFVYEKVKMYGFDNAETNTICFVSSDLTHETGATIKCVSVEIIENIDPAAPPAPPAPPAPHTY